MSDAAPTTTPLTGCVVLAAGSSQRFGSDKRRFQFAAGRTLLEQTLSRLQPLFRERMLVLRPGDDALAAQFGDHWKIIVAADAQLGMGHSLAAAAPYFQAWSGAVIALADMPWVAEQTLQSISQILTADTLVVPHYQGQRGNPVGIGADYFPELARLQGDTGARALFQRHASKLVKLEVPDPGILQDMDTPPT
jgi:molybdenum cofactor cytidylyltransferase